MTTAEKFFTLIVKALARDPFTNAREWANACGAEQRHYTYHRDAHFVSHGCYVFAFADGSRVKISADGKKIFPGW